jgi:hypothetical protein
MAMIPSRFEQVLWNTFRKNACSPAPAEAERGLFLAAPVRVTLSDQTPLPVAGAYRVGARFLNRFRSMNNEIVVVAVDAATHAPRSTNLLAEGFEAAPSGFDPSYPALDNLVVTGHFNLDLFHWMTDLPRAPARYHVFATVGDVVSNVVTIAVVAS